MSFSRLIEDIEKGSGKFDLEKTYFINNATDEDIIVTWGAMEPEARGAGTYKIKAGDKGGPYPQFLAYHIVKALVSREMIKDGKAKFFGSAELRAPYEDKFLVEIDQSDGEDPFTAAIREQERAKILEEMKTTSVASEGITSSETRREVVEKKKEFEGAKLD